MVTMNSIVLQKIVKSQLISKTFFSLSFDSSLVINSLKQTRL